MSKENKFRSEEQKKDFSDELERKFADCVPVNIYEMAKGQYRSRNDSTESTNMPSVIYRATINLND